MRKASILLFVIFFTVLLCLSLPPRASTEIERRSQPSVLPTQEAPAIKSPAAKRSGTKKLKEPLRIGGASAHGEHKLLADAAGFSAAFPTLNPAPQTGVSACNQFNVCAARFDDVATGVDIRNRYAQIKFAGTGDAGIFTKVNSTGSPARSLPNSIVTGNANEPLTVTFPNPVSAVSFFILAIDDPGIIARIETFDGGTLTGRFDVLGNTTHTPQLIDFGARRITQMRVVSITDRFGFTYDDFEFSLILPTAPRNLRAPSVTGHQVSLAWDAGSDTTTYQVKRGPRNTGPFTVIGTTSGTTFVDNGVSPGETHFYVVTPFNLGGQGSDSNVLPILTPLAAPTLLAATTFPDDPSHFLEVRLEWNAPERVDRFNIKRSRVSGRDYVTFAHLSDPITQIGPGPVGSTVKLDEPDTNYFYVVSAVKSGVESPNSNEIPAQVLQTCGYKTFTPRPSPRAVTHFDWAMRTEVSDKDGLVIRDLALNGRYLTNMMSVPYVNVFVKQPDGFLRTLRVELTPDNSNPTPHDPSRVRARLIAYNPNYTDTDSNGRILSGVMASYIVDHLFPGSVSCLKITQKYLFGFREEGGCELSSTLPCARFYPKVEYDFDGKGRETLMSIVIPQRLHHRIEDQPASTVGLFRDCDALPLFSFSDPRPFPCLNVASPLESQVFEKVEHPVREERQDLVVSGGRDQRAWDNVHQTNKNLVGGPFPADLNLSERVEHGQLGGCPECFHSHWRWGAESSTLAETLRAYFFRRYSVGPPSFGGGNLIGFGGNNTNQDLKIAVVRFNPNPDEIHPPDYERLVNGENMWKQETSVQLSPSPGTIIVKTTKQDTVLWYTTTGRNTKGTTFEYGAFANWNRSLIASDVQPGQAAGASGGASSSASVEDGPKSLTYEFGYREGTTTSTPFDPNIVGPLPQGYAHFNNVGYEIKTEAVGSGNLVVTFTVPSVTSQAAFNNLRILQAEHDPFNPKGAIWADHTILAPDPQAPDFATRTIRVRTSHLGLFVIASLTNQPVNPKTANIAVSAEDSPDPIVAGNDLTYTLNVSNLGPDAATQVGLVNNLSPDVSFVSVSPVNVDCKFDQGSVYCNLGALGVGATKTISIVVKPLEKSRNRFPDTGQEIGFSAYAASVKETDSNLDNNTARATTKVFPDPNAAPTVRITAPADGAILTGPTNIIVTAEASDSDGAVSQVVFYGDGAVIGSGELVSAGQYRFNWNNVGFGTHSLWAVAVDNGGRRAVSDTVNLLVNGPASVNITSPASGSFLLPNSTVNITATASHPSGTISKVQFFANENLIGEATASSGNQYSLT